MFSFLSKFFKGRSTAEDEISTGDDSGLVVVYDYCAGPVMYYRVENEEKYAAHLKREDKVDPRIGKCWDDGRKEWVDA